MQEALEELNELKFSKAALEQQCLEAEEELKVSDIFNVESMHLYHIVSSQLHCRGIFFSLYSKILIYTLFQLV